MRVVIAGAGLGGLVLAQALRDRADVVVLERDRAPEDTGGYRIALTPEAVAVVERHVPAKTVRRIRAVSDDAGTFAQFTIADRRLRPLVVAAEPQGADRMLCQRRALRVLLAEGLGERVRYGRAVVSAASTDRGAAVTLADGSRVEGDVVVAADGARSATLRGIAAGETSADLGLVGIAGSSPLSGAPLPRYLLSGPALAVDHRGLGVFLSLASRLRAPAPPDLADAVGPPSLVWGLILRSALAPAAGAAPDELVRRAIALVDGWRPWLAEQIAASEPGRVSAYPFRAARTRGPRFPWHPSRITAIGDAVHAMPPTGGRAGATAIRSAGALADALLSSSDVDDALRSYERRVDEWAVPAIAESLQPVAVIRALRHRPLQLAARPLLAVAGVIGANVHRARP